MKLWSVGNMIIVACVSVILLFVLVIAIRIPKHDQVATVPQSCITALDTAEQLVHGPVVEQTKDMAILSNLVSQAFDAGVTGNEAEAQNIIDTLHSLSDRATTRDSDVRALIAKYNVASQKCRDASGKGA